MKRAIIAFAAIMLCGAIAIGQTPQPGEMQSTYKPKFAGDPARSDSEAAALGYMRVVVNAQKNYKKKKGQYATSLPALVGHGSFTKRMTSTDRGEYQVRFSGKPDGYSLWMTPAAMDAMHRAFFVDESGKIKAEEDKQASSSSPSVSAK